MDSIWNVAYLLLLVILSGLLVFYVIKRIKPFFRENRKSLFRVFSGKALKHHLGSPAISAASTLVLILLLDLSSTIIPGGLYGVLATFLKILFVASIAWCVYGSAILAEEAFLERFDISAQDNLRARKIYTQVAVFRKLASIAIGILAFSFILMSFPEFRQIGAGILASVGVAGIIVGLAAQRTVGTLLAGVQLAIAQPIRIDDVLVVEGEWGRVEEITFTYVVVRIWDSRRLVLPTTYFLEHPFQNWTRVSSDLLATVFIYVDYSANVADIRAMMKEFLQSSPHWDGRVCALQVTDCSERTMELRALMSAADSSKAWELRCEIREKLLDHLRSSFPGSLPKVRIERERSSPGINDPKQYPEDTEEGFYHERNRKGR